MGTVTIIGPEAAAKAQRAGDAIVNRARRLAAERGLTDFLETSIEVLGAESTYGPQARKAARASREVVLKIGARHADERALEILAREIIPAACSMAQGLTGFFAGRPNVQPVIRLFSFLWPKDAVTPLVHLDADEIAAPFESPRFRCLAGSESQASYSSLNTLGSAPSPLAGEGWGEGGQISEGDPPHPARFASDPLPQGERERGAAARETIAAEMEQVPLIALAVGRSGDKGNAANIGIIARRPNYLPWIRAALTPEAVRAFFAHTGVSRVERFDLPGIHAINFVLHDALGGGGVASLRIDPQGKAFAQMLMDHPVEIPGGLLARQPEKDA
jgi:hypothetical protein